MRAPQLNRQMVLETPQRVADGAGGFAQSWQALGTVWVSLSARSGREAGGPAGALSQVRHRVVMRAAPMGHEMRPVAGQRLRMGSRIFAVEAVSDEPDQPLYLRCDVTEEVAT